MALGLLWAPRLPRYSRLAVPSLLLGSCVHFAVHVPTVWLWAVLHPLTHGSLHVAILAGGLLIGAGFGALRPIGRAWFVLLAAALMAPISLGMLAGAVTYPPYPPSQSETPGVVMLVAMQSLWLLALPAPPRGRLAGHR